MLGIDVEDGRVTGVRTDAGDVEAEIVVDCGGMFAAEIGRMAGVRVPVVPMSHQYLVTEPLRERDGTRLPTLRDPDNLVYFREEVDGLVMGGYERASAPWSLGPADQDAVPGDFNGRLLAEDWDRFEEITANSRRRVPAMAEAGHPQADQRAGGVHPGQRVLPGRDGGGRASSSRPGSARTASRARAASARSWPSGSWPASRRWTSGTWTSGGSAAHYRSPSYTL